MTLPLPLADLENNIVSLFKYGNKEVYQQLYNKYAPAVLGVLNRILKDQELAEVCMQDVFWTIWAKRHEYDPSKERLFTWIIKIAKNCAVCIPEDEKLRFADEVREEIDLVYATDIRQYLHDIQAELGESSAFSIEAPIRKAIHLIYFEGYSFRGAADQLELSVDTLRESMIKTIKHIKGSLLA